MVVDASALVADPSPVNHLHKQIHQQSRSNNRIYRGHQPAAHNRHLFLKPYPTNANIKSGTTMACYFKDKSALTSLSKEQSVTVKGTMQDMSIGIIDMQDCSLVK